MMQRPWWILFSSGAGVLMCAGVFAFASLSGPRLATAATAAVPGSASDHKTAFSPTTPQVQEAQFQQPAAAPTARPPTAAPARPAQEAPRRVETTTYDSWTVTCDTTPTGTAKKKCIANLRLSMEGRGVVLDWQIGSNEENRYVTAIHIPSAVAVKQGDKTVGGPIKVDDGLDLKFGNGGSRRLNFVVCGPKQCVAEAAIDDVFAKEAAANTKATITVHTPEAAIPFEIAINGIDKAIASTR